VNDIVIVDNSPASYMFHPRNAVSGIMVMPMTNLPAVSTRKLVLVSGASDMLFSAKFFWCWFSVTNRTVLYLHSGLSYQFFGTGF